MLGKCVIVFVGSASFFSKLAFTKDTFRNNSESQTVCILIRNDVLRMSVPIWVQTVGKSYLYQQTAKVAFNKVGVKTISRPF